MPLPMALKDTAKKYAQAMSDGRILSNRAALDVIDQRVMELMGRVDRGDAPERMAHLYSLFQDFRKAWKKGDDAELVVLLNSMDTEFETVYHDYKAWEQIIVILGERRKMVESEIKIFKDLKAILTAEQAMNLVGKLLGIITKYVHDKKALRAISFEFSRIVGENDLQKTDVVDVEPMEEVEE